MMGVIHIDTNESFPHLSHAPITEAVLEFRGRALAPWDEKALLADLKVRLPDYPDVKSRRELKAQVEFKAGSSTPQVSLEDLEWSGFEMRAGDRPQVVRFQRDRFSFSRLAPYEDWARFIKEALRLWAVHVSVAQPSMVPRIGLRFINQLPLPQGDLNLDDYLTAPPTTPTGLDWPFVKFLHRDTLEVSGHPYLVSVTRTIRPAGKPDTTGVAKLVVDIDVSTRFTSPIERESVVDHLSALRWLKNKVFFASLRKPILESLE